MKLSIVFLAILGLAVAAPANEVHSRKARSLSDDLADFAALIDLDKVLNVAIQYLAEDEEIQKMLLYVQSDEFIDLVILVNAIPAYISFLNYLEAAGLQVYQYINLLSQILGIPEVGTRSVRSVNSRITGGIIGLFIDITAVLPVEEIKALYREKINTSPDFVELIETLASDEFQTIVTTLRNDSNFQNLVAKLEALGVDVSAAVLFFNTLIGLA